MLPEKRRSTLAKHGGWPKVRWWDGGFVIGSSNVVVLEKVNEMEVGMVEFWSCGGINRDGGEEDGGRDM